MTDLELCKQVVLVLVGSNEELAARWWLSPNKAFNMETPNSKPIADVVTYLIQFL